MALVVYDRVQQTGTANTTVSFTLSGSVAGFQSFAVVGNGNTTYYAATDASGNWEVGLGTYSTTGPTLTRTTVLSSSNSNLAVTFSGTCNIFLTYPASTSVYEDTSGNVSPLGTITSGTWNGTTIGVAYGGTGVTSSSGANSVMLRDASQNVAINRLNQANTNTAAAAGVTTLTAASAYSQTLTGTGSQTFRMPDATTLSTGVAFIFNNNATGTLTLQDSASGAIGTITAGGAVELICVSTATVAGTWDYHGFLPENVTWGTNALAMGSTVVTGGTWQGGTIQSGYGGTGLTTFTAANNALYSTSASALAAGTLPVAAGGTGATTLTLNGVVYGNGTSAAGITAAGTTGQVLIATTSGAPSWGSVPTTAAVTSITFGSTGLTPATATTGAVTVAGTLVAANGGTGQSSYAVGDLLYASTTTALSKLADVATGNALISGGVGVAPSYGKIGLTTHISGTLAVGNGGTGLTTLTAGYIPFGNGTSPFNSSANLVWDNNNFRLGLGTASPITRLQANAVSATTSSTILTLYGSETGFSGSNDSGTGYSINFDGCSYNGVGGITQQTGATIQMLKTSTWNEAAGGTGTLGNLVFKTNSGTAAVPALTERMRIDYSGNVGIGVTPSAWGSQYKAMQIGTAGATYANTNANTVGLTCNYYGATSTDVYLTTGFATRYYQFNGQHIWNTAASGTAGNAITFTQAMTLDASGRLMVGVTSTTSKLQVYGGSGIGGIGICNGGASTNSYNADTHTFTTGNGTVYGITINSSGYAGVGASTTATTPLQVWGTTNSGYATSNAITNGGSAISNAGALANGSSLRLTANFGGAIAYTGRGSELVFGADNANFGSGGGFGQGNLGAITAISEVGNATTLASSMLFYTTSANAISERMRINSSGNVGIGTSSPNSKLEVVGNSDVLSIKSANDTGSNYIAFKNTSGTTLWDAGIGNTIRQDEYVIRRAGTPVMYMSNASNVGIGTTGPGQKLTVASGNIGLSKTYSVIWNDSNDEIRVDDNPAWYGGAANVMTFKAYNGGFIFRNSATSVNSMTLDLSGNLSATSFSGAVTLPSTNPFVQNATTLSANLTITGNNAMAAGPITINTSVTLTIATGARVVIV